MKANSGSRDIAPFALDLGTRWHRVFSFTLCGLYPPENNPHTDWTRGYVEPTAGLDGLEKIKISSLCPDRPAG